MDQRPLRFLLTAWPWRSLAYLITGAALGVVVVGVFAVPSAGLVLGGVPLAVSTAVLLVAATIAVGPLLAVLERHRIRLVDEPLPAPSRPPGSRWRAPSTWREIGFALLSATGLAGLDACVLGCSFVLPVLLFGSPADDPAAWPLVIVGVLLLVAAPWTITAWAGARAALTRTVLGPRGTELGAGLADVATTRARLVGAFETERARIERDLHDGAQQRLVAVGVSLGLARLDVDDNSAPAARLDDAREQLGLALGELRDLIRGLDPRMLADHGLAAAVTEQARRCPVPVEADLRLPDRLPPEIASTAYFVLTEALTNIARHSGAGAASVSGRSHADQVILEIRDDGRGGADPAAGSGLDGLAERVALAGGRFRLSSPAGGPTLLRVELPCG
ncbi:signal transduction histidine kinase [Pseudonocardia autotrophica]|uniref:histidine kinase n=2 Tax=Pseudonocardia TaxID=1847 RepID=A0A1Y2MZQ6_PSEAH|nr:Oxygen sensor histidine kinase NreB [Pseudonocardia autotrophica]TDN72334.1 signal transduction histidine kinase [Pseudonocardia autotrophica]